MGGTQRAALVPGSSCTAGCPTPAPAPRCVTELAQTCPDENPIAEETCVRCKKGEIPKRERNMTVIPCATYFCKENPFYCMEHYIFKTFFPWWSSFGAAKL